MSETIPFLARSDDSDRHAWIKALGAAMPDHHIKCFEGLTDAELLAARVAIVADPDPAELALLPNLIWIHSLWAGVERIVEDLARDGPTIVRLQDPQMAKTMAEAVLAWTLYLHRGMPQYRRQQEDRIWQEHPLPLPSERMVGILGLGVLGRVAASRLLQQEFRVCGWSRSGTRMDNVQTFKGPGELDQMLSACDIVVVLMPLTAETRNLLDGGRLSAMRKGASLINFARGPIVDTQALIDHLDSSHLDHAVLDVFDEEPLPREHALWGHPQVTVLPHISGPTNRATASAIVAHNIRAFIESGKVPPGVDRTRGY